MITLPKNVEKLEYSVCKNAIWRCYGQDEISIDNSVLADIKSRKPFIVEQNGRRILFTSNPSEVIPNDCAYAILVKRMLTAPLYQAGDLKIIRFKDLKILHSVSTPSSPHRTQRR